MTTDDPSFLNSSREKWQLAKSEGTNEGIARLNKPAGLISAFFSPAFFSPELSYSSSLLFLVSITNYLDFGGS